MRLLEDLYYKKYIDLKCGYYLNDERERVFASFSTFLLNYIKLFWCDFKVFFKEISGLDVT